jgi:uncharacterized protein YbjT (DUF2867 family)
MDKALVVGASGQLGTAVTKKLLNRRIPVRTLVRSSEQASRFLSLGAEPVRADLTDAASLKRAFVFTSARTMKHEAISPFLRYKREPERALAASGIDDGLVCVGDVAGFLAAAACGDPSGTYAAGGPEALSFRDVVRIYERVPGAAVKARTTPAEIFRVLAASGGFGVQLTTAETFLRTKSAAAAAG